MDLNNFRYHLWRWRRWAARRAWGLLRHLSFDHCLMCSRHPADCRCTGGPMLEIECTCYEANGGHEPGCPARPRR